MRPAPRRVRLLVVMLSVVFALQGLSWVVLGSLEPTGFYDGLLARSQLGLPALTPEAAATQRFLLIPFGATDAAYFTMAALVGWFGFRERWALGAVAGSFALWWVVDSVGCAVIGAWFNVWVVNVPCLLAYGTALSLWAWTRPAASDAA